MDFWKDKEDVLLSRVPDLQATWTSTYSIRYLLRIHDVKCIQLYIKGEESLTNQNPGSSSPYIIAGNMKGKINLESALNR